MSTQEEILRKWLSGEDSGDSLDPKIKETVYVLSPSRAPEPSQKIDQLFLRLRGGPLSLLPEEELIEDVESIFGAAQLDQALPKGSISDLFARIEEGPLASGSEIHTTETPALSTQTETKEPPKDNVVPFPIQKWSMWGSILAAAGVLLFMFQQQNPLSMQLEQELQSSSAEYSIEREETKAEVAEEAFVDESIDAPPPKTAAPKREAKRKESAPGAFTPKEEDRQREVQDAPQRKKQEAKPVPLLDREQNQEKESSVEVDIDAGRHALPLPEPQKAEEIVEEEAMSPMSQSLSPTKSPSQDVQTILREEATRGLRIPTTTEFSSLSLAELRVHTQGADQQKLYMAAYEIALSYPQEIPYLASLLRIKNENSREKKILLILMADEYERQNQKEMALQLYREAIAIP